MSISMKECRAIPALAPTTGLVGRSPALDTVRLQISVAAQYEEPVLIVGETGTGKEVVARAIHALSPRGEQPLHIVNCGAVPQDLLTAELFGHRSGAFTGAHRSRPGRIRAASGSSLFLDEISETSNHFQVALLRAVDLGEVQPVGEDQSPEKTDVRFIAATNRPPGDLGKEEVLRQDLLYRISSFVIEVPPLRERPEDIGTLVRHFCEGLEEKYGRHWRFTGPAIGLLREHPFPGNVRELRQIVFAACVSSATSSVSARHVHHVIGRFPDRPAAPRPTNGNGRALHPLLRRHISETILVAECNLSKAARLLEVPRSTLQHMLVRHDIDLEHLRSETLESGATPIIASDSAYATLNV